MPELLAPNSSVTRFRLQEASSCANFVPVSAQPLKEVSLISKCDASKAPVSLLTDMILKRPGAFLPHPQLAEVELERAVVSDAFVTIVFLPARHGASFTTVNTAGPSKE